MIYQYSDGTYAVPLGKMRRNMCMDKTTDTSDDHSNNASKFKWKYGTLEPKYETKSTQTAGG